MRRISILRILRARPASGTLGPAEYWEQRAPDLVHGYDHPETWAKRGWMAGGVEEKLVPQLLREHRIGSVLVVGAGTGRQYGFFSDLSIDVRGFDISPALVRAARARHPAVETLVDDLIGAEQRHAPADAVLSTAVLQHVAPEQIHDAVRTVESLARRLIVIREVTWLAVSSTYQWAHDYSSLFSDWDLARQVVTDDNERCRVELRALVRRPA
jgi:SAM-dependent methyltransferase